MKVANRDTILKLANGIEIDFLLNQKINNIWKNSQILKKVGKFSILTRNH